MHRETSKLRTKRENCNRSVKCNEVKRYLFLRDNEKGSHSQPRGVEVRRREEKKFCTAEGDPGGRQKVAESTNAIAGFVSATTTEMTVFIIAPLQPRQTSPYSCCR